MDKNILMVIPPSNFRDEELLIPKRIFIEKKEKVFIASLVKDRIRGMLGAKTDIDFTIDKIQGNFDAVVFVGGSGIEEYKLYDNKDILNLAKAFSYRGKIVTAICLGTKILANADLLKNRKATTTSSAIEYIKSKGAKYQESSVVKDLKIITASGPDAAKEFAETILNSLKDREE